MNSNDIDKPEHTTDNPLTRRQLLQTAATASLALLLPMLSERAEAAGTPHWTMVGPAKQFLKGHPHRVAVAGGGVIYVTRLGKTTLSAVSAKCTHRGCEVGWDVGDKYFHCPCHGAVFGSSGKNVHGTRRQPDETLPPLASVPARQWKGQVQVNIQALPAGELQPHDD